MMLIAELSTFNLREILIYYIGHVRLHDL